MSQPFDSTVRSTGRAGIMLLVGGLESHRLREPKPVYQEGWGKRTLLAPLVLAHPMTSSMVLVRTTVGTRDAAHDLARRLVDAGLAACVHVQELTSVYHWKGNVEEHAEWLIEARALASREASVREAMLAGHPYELPLVETLIATGISKAYLDWARQS